MSKLIVLLPRLNVSDANAQGAWWFVGPPGPTAYAGFGLALARTCLPPEQLSAFVGVGVVLHDHRLRAEKPPNSYSWLPHQFRAAALINDKDYSKKNKHALSLQPSARCDLKISLAVVFKPGCDLDPDKVEKFMRNARIAGGVVGAERHNTMLLSNMDEVCDVLKSGFALHSRQDLMQPAEGEDSLDALLRATQPTKENMRANPWLMPATMGFATVTAAKDRVWTRDGLPHAFAEPLVGLAQWKSIRRTPSIPVWKYQRPSERVFVVGTESKPNPTPLYY